MNIAFCYESVLPTRGGCETYIAGLARRLVADGHDVHLYACRWDEQALPAGMHYHRIELPLCPRFLRPWWFARACQKALQNAGHQVTMGFDKIWGLDVVYPQGGLYAAAAHHNLLKHRSRLTRQLIRLCKMFDPAHQSFRALERRQYLAEPRPLIIAISELVRNHFQNFLGIPSENLRLVRLATDPNRFCEQDRPKRRHEWREHWNIRPDMTVALFAGLNYRLKGLEPLLHALRLLPANSPLCLLVAGNKHTADFEALAQRLGVSERVRFAGYCPDMRNCYFAADFFVHPTFYDPCSHVVLEAMLCGLPVITTVNNGAAEMMRPPQEGYVLEDPHDHARLAWTLTQFLDPARRHAAGQAARRSAAQWTFEHHYQQIMQVFSEVVRRKQAA